MDVSDLFRSDGDEAVVLHVHLQPGAGRSAVVGRHGSALKVRVAAAPEAGRANDACAALLADTFALKASQVELVNGPTSRSKQFRLSGIEAADFEVHLERVVEVAQAGKGRPSSTPGHR